MEAWPRSTAVPVKHSEDETEQPAPLGAGPLISRVKFMLCKLVVMKGTHLC